VSRSLVPVREQDLSRFRDWRNMQSDFLRQSVPLKDSDQLRWYREVVLPSRETDKPGLLMFSFLEGGVCVGYCGLTHIDWTKRSAEVVFLVDTLRLNDTARYQADFAWCLDELKMTAFGDLKLARLVMENHDMRPYHIEALERAGFRQEERRRGQVEKNGRKFDLLIHSIHNPTVAGNS
jgi:RimJ/RimL family protein N-acetyltransferase